MKNLTIIIEETENPGVYRVYSPQMKSEFFTKQIAKSVMELQREWAEYCESLQ